MANPVYSASKRKELIKDLKFFEKARKKLKSKDVVDLWAWQDIKEAIGNVKELLSFIKK